MLSVCNIPNRINTYLLICYKILSLFRKNIFVFFSTRCATFERQKQYPKYGIISGAQNASLNAFKNALSYTNDTHIMSRMLHNNINTICDAWRTKGDIWLSMGISVYKNFKYDVMTLRCVCVKWIYTQWWNGRVCY